MLKLTWTCSLRFCHQLAKLQEFYKKAAVKPALPQAFLLTDSQITDERFLVFINVTWIQSIELWSLCVILCPHVVDKSVPGNTYKPKIRHSTPLEVSAMPRTFCQAATFRISLLERCKSGATEHCMRWWTLWLAGWIHSWRMWQVSSCFIDFLTSCWIADWFARRDRNTTTSSQPSEMQQSLLTMLMIGSLSAWKKGGSFFVLFWLMQVLENRFMLKCLLLAVFDFVLPHFEVAFPVLLGQSSCGLTGVDQWWPNSANWAGKGVDRNLCQAVRPYIIVNCTISEASIGVIWKNYNWSSFTRQMGFTSAPARFQSPSDPVPFAGGLHLPHPWTKVPCRGLSVLMYGGHPLTMDSQQPGKFNGKQLKTSEKNSEHFFFSWKAIGENFAQSCRGTDLLTLMKWKMKWKP